MTLELARGFSSPTEDAWREAAEKAAKGAPLEKLRAKTEDGFELEPLYRERPEGAEGERPGAFPFTRGHAPDGARTAGWSIRQPFTDADLDRTNAAILRDLERGVTDVLLVLDAATARGLDPDSAEAASFAGQGGLPLASVDDLDLALAGVLDELAPVVIEGGIAPLAQASLLIALWQRRGRDLSEIRGSLGAAPLSAWARIGALPGGPARALEDVAELARWCAESAPRVRVARADEAPFHEAGASDAEGLGLVLAEAAAHLRAFAAAGHDLATGAGQLELSLSLGSDVFAGIAKLRAARRAWSRLAEVLGLAPDAPRPALVARLGRRALTRHDPWVNLLRGTAATFAASVGGAEAFTLEPFDAALGVPDELGRRMARNTQLILQEESHLAKVVDPAGGSFYLEHRTEALAAAAWGVLQEIEKAGGLAEALGSGLVQERVVATRDRRAAAIDTRRRPLTGVSEFPDPNEKPVRRSSAQASAVAERARKRLELCRARLPSIEASALEGDRAARAIELAARGATLGGLHAALAGAAEPARITPLAPRRLSEGFERLRDAVLEAAPPPVQLANVGPLARHAARATFVQNLVGVAGFRAEHGPPTSDPEAAAAAFRETGAMVAVICGADEDYAEHAADFARALKAAGARRVLLAGKPRALERALEEAGLDGHVALGTDVRAALEALLAAHDIRIPEGDPR